MNSAAMQFPTMKPQDMKSMSAWGWYCVALVVGAGLAWYSGAHPAHLPFWMPWQFHWPEYLGTVLTLAWYFRGLKRLPKDLHPAMWRKISFVAGVASIYIVLQTGVDYYAQHLFFVHRWAHYILHHGGTFAIALGMSGPVLYAGMPEFLHPIVNSRPVQKTLDFVQTPIMAPFLFVGLLYFWLIPQIHTHVMLNEPLYEFMNWTMTINGIMFWSLVLDSRAHPPARLSHLKRALMILMIELPQMALGAVLTFSHHDVYPVYNICGRVLSMTALTDQHLGGLVIWLPGTFTSAAAMFIVLTSMRLNEEKAERESGQSVSWPWLPDDN
jgi:putative membrane protein